MLSPLEAEIEAVSRHVPGHSIESAIRYAEQEGIDAITSLLGVVGDHGYSDQARWIACWSLFWIGNAARDALNQACHYDTRAERLTGLLPKKHETCRKLLETLQQGSMDERIEALDNEDLMYSREALPHIIEALHSDNPRIRSAASWPLLLAEESVIGPENVPLEQLIRVVKDLDGYREPDIHAIMICEDAFKHMGLKPPTP